MAQSKVNLPPTGSGDAGPIPVAVKKAATGEAVQQFELTTTVEGGAITPIAAGNPLQVGIVGTVPISGAPTTVTANLGTLNGAALDTSVQSVLTGVGTPTDAAATTTGSVIAQLRRIANSLAGTLGISAASLPLPAGASTETTLAAASAKLPAALGAHGGLVIEGVASGVAIPVSGSFAGVSDLTASGTLTTSGQAVSITGMNGMSVCQVQLTGSVAGLTILAEAQIDGTNWVAVPRGAIIGDVIDQITSAQGYGAIGNTIVPVAGYSGFRIRISAGSGSLTVALRASAGASLTTLAGMLPAGTNTIGTAATTSAAASQADGHSASIGSTTDAAATTTGSVIAQLRRIANAVAGTLTVSGTVTTTPPSNASTNLAQVAGATTAVGHGVAATALRVELPTDGTGVVGLAAGAAAIGSVTVTGTPAVDTELPAAAALADGVSSTPSVPTVGAALLGHDSNGATLNRIKTIWNGFNVALTGVLAAGHVAQFDDVAPTAITENNVGIVRMSANRNQYQTIRDAAGNERGANVNASGELQVAPTANAAVNNAQINGVTPLMGAGITGTGSLRTTPATANTGTAATGFTATTSTVALSTNAAARLRTIYNNSDQDCFVNLAAAVVSATSYHVKVPKLGGFFSTSDYSGEIRAIMASAIGAGQVNFGEMT